MESWLRQYNEERPHESLGDLAPTEFLLKNLPKEISTFGWYQLGEVYTESGSGVDDDSDTAHYEK